MNTAKELFVYGLNNMLDAEQRLVPALGEMALQSRQPELAKAFESHKAQTEKQIERLQEVFEEVEEEAEAGECRGIAALLEERNNFHEQQSPSDDIAAVFDISAASQVESYEINAYTSLILLAEELELARAVKLLNQNLKEEQQALAKMEKLQNKIQPEEVEVEEEEEEEAEFLEGEDEAVLASEQADELVASDDSETEAESEGRRETKTSGTPRRKEPKKGRPGRAA